ncbi:MAG: hypothetical protein ISR64_07185 [Deltaproteobacteria bacterium]|nr:hypothetical protein [Deltaproteobacteria bacterium]
MASPTRKAKSKRKAKEAAMGSRRKRDIRRADKVKIEELGRKLGILPDDKDKEGS